jgi:hypothetical protein
MRQRHLLCGIPLVVALLGAGAPAFADSASAYQAVLGHYEGIRVALVADDLSAAKRHAGALAAGLQPLEGELTSSRAGVPTDRLAVVRGLLPPLRGAAVAMRDASNLEAAREAFYGATAALVRWRALAGQGPQLVRCTMKNRVWLQPAGSIGNPYYGRAMARCGEFVPMPSPKG